MDAEVKTRRQRIDAATAALNRAFTDQAAAEARKMLAHAEAEAADAKVIAAVRGVDQARMDLAEALAYVDPSPADRAAVEASQAGAAEPGRPARLRTLEERKADLLGLLSRTVNFVSEHQPANAELDAVWLWPSKRQVLKLRDDGWHIQAFTTQEIHAVLTPDDIAAMLAQPNWAPISQSAA